MTPIDITKNVVSFVVGAGTYSIAKTIIKNQVEPETPVQKIAVNSSSLVIATMASEATTSWTDQKIDDLVQWWNDNVTVTPPKQ